MPTNLKNLTVREVSLVDRPANSEVDPETGMKIPRAVVALFKHDDDDAGGNVEKWSSNQGRDNGKWKTGGGVGKDQHAAEGASTSEQHKAAADHHMIQAVRMTDATAATAHRLASDAHRMAGENPSKAASLAARNLSRAAGHFGVAKDDGPTAEEIQKAVDGKTEDGKVFPRSDYAHAPGDDVSAWKLRLTRTPGGPPDPAIIGAAAAAFSPGGHRGQQVALPADAREAAKAKVRAAWRKANPDKDPAEMPESIKKSAEGDQEEMPEITLADLAKKQADQDALFAKMSTDFAAVQKENGDLKATVSTLKAENELVQKMSKKERKMFGGLDDKKKAEYMAGDAEKRKQMMDACEKEMEEAEKKAAKKSTAKDDEEPDGDEDGEDMKKMESLIQKMDQRFELELKKRDSLIEKQNAELDRIRKRERQEHFISIAKADLSHLSGSDVEKADSLIEIAEKLGGENSDLFKNYLATQKAADAVIARDFREIGKHGGGGSASPTAMLEAKTTEIMKRDGINKDLAFNKAMLENPQLYEEYETARQGKR